ncbi:hypothetical protein C7448_10117 [Tenacibaculum gallaicum]|uniref:MORN repeat protein n=1 Tax=Tenacibaculum gallaicum TaxID=561505 RepID=A0A3E0IBC8_9FLAO|nr:hypothetical protein [Tenacibaculum gallaicum]REH55989.1 hypothetical protein C7448_10117 [Tenacibaculum gallaicum]
MKLKEVLIILLSLTSIGLGVYSFTLNKENSRLTDSKNFTFEWKNSYEVLTSYWKDNNKISSQYFDVNFDYNYEIARVFTTYGKVYQTCFDRNENGVYEKTDCYNSAGDKVGYSLDNDEDGVPEEFVLIYDSKKELKFIDSDFDGKFEKIIIINNSNETELLTKTMFEE